MLKTTPTSLPTSEVGVGSVEDQGVELYGCFSPHRGASPSSALCSDPPTAKGEAIGTVVAPVLQIMPELQELCEKPASPISIVPPLADSLVVSVAPSPPTPPPMETS